MKRLTLTSMGWLTAMALLSATAAHGAPRQPAAEVSSPAESGLARRQFEDPERSLWTQTGSRPVRIVIWLPNPPRDAAASRGGAATSPAFTRPLILLSHGSGGRAEHMAWLGRPLASQGYLVAAVEHLGDPDEELRSVPAPSDYFAWERARDLSVALDRLLADAELGPVIDRDCIGAAGFSLGGTSALWLTGARLSLQQLHRGAPPPPAFMAPALEKLKGLAEVNLAAKSSLSRAEKSYRDPRVKSVFALAPAIGFGFTDESLGQVRTPVEIVVGAADRVNPPADNARRLAQRIPGARYLELSGERGHFSAATPHDAQGAQMAEVAELAVGFFQDSLGRCASPVR